MKILVITPWFPNRPHDQHGNFILDSIEAVQAAGHELHVLVTRPFIPAGLGTGRPDAHTRIAPEMRARGMTIDVRRYPSIPGNYSRAIANRLYVHACATPARALARHYGVDVIHAHTDMAGYVACTVRDAVGVPVVTTLHGVNTSARYWHGLGQRAFFETVCRCPERLVLVGEPLLAFAGA